MRSPGSTSPESPAPGGAMRTLVAAAALLALPLVASAQAVLLTPRFNITVIGCEEGHVSCDEVKYIGVNRRTGATIRLKGSTLHTYAQDGVTPSRFLGYRFMNGNTVYQLQLDGVLVVTQSGKPLMREQGTWLDP